MGVLDVMFFLCMFVLLQVAASLMSLIGAGSVLEVVMAYVAVIGVFILCKWSPVSINKAKSHKKSAILLTVLLGAALVLPSSWIDEKLGLEMPEAQEQLILHMLANPIGVVAVVVLAPLSEELVFRGAILRTLLSIIPVSKKRYWISIALSALCFAIIHGNLAQGCHAFVIGLLMGWLFFSTGSILLGMIIHFMNNLSAYLFYAFSGNPEITVEEMFGGNTLLMYSALVISVLVACGCLYKLTTSKLTK